MKRALLVLLLILVACAKRKKGPSYRAAQITAQGSATCAVMEDRSLRCWGAAGSEFPDVVPGFAEVTRACASDARVCALENGRARCKGEELGEASHLSCERDRACTWFKDELRCGELRLSLSGVVALSSGPTASCAVLADGSARCWGSNEDGLLGDGTTEPRAGLVTPKVTGVRAIAIGARHACAALENELVSCWGRNTRGQLGDGTFTDHFAPSVVPNLAGIDVVAAGGAHTCVHRKDDTVRCFGANDHHQLGLGAETEGTPSPAMVSGLYEATAVVAGESFTCARMKDGWLRCWGANEAGQLGDGTRLERAVPVPIRF